MKEVLSDKSFKLMSLIMKAMETIHPQAKNRAKTFGIREGMTIVDYGCGPGRYIIPFAQIVGEQGNVIGVDLSKIALEEIEKKVHKYNLNNVQFKLAEGYYSGIDSEIADMVFALDMFFMIEKPTDFLKELSRIGKKDCILVIDDGHQSRMKTKKKISDANTWKIVEENKDFLKCKKI